MIDGSASLVQSIAEDGQEYDRCNDTLESEEVLDLGIGDAQEGKLEQEVEQETNHSRRSDALVFGYVIGNVSEARPDGCE